MDATIPGVILDWSSARNNYVSAPAAFVGAATGNAFIALAPARVRFSVQFPPAAAAATTT